MRKVFMKKLTRTTLALSNSLREVVFCSAHTLNSRKPILMPVNNCIDNLPKGYGTQSDYLPYGQEPDPIVEEEEGEYVIPNPEGKQTTAEQIENLVPQDRRAYQRQYTIRIDEFYTRIAELQNLIQEEKWYLTLEFRNYYVLFS